MRAVRRRIPNNERFWKFVQTSDDCWIWLGNRNHRRYGQFSFRQSDGKYKTVMAHRFAYELLIGPIPEGKVLDHIECDTPPCVNPGHTVPATIGENSLRGKGPCAVHARLTHCLNGHPFDGS